MATRKQTEPDSSQTSTTSKPARSSGRSTTSTSKASTGSTGKGSTKHASKNSSSFLSQLKDPLANVVPGHENEFLFAIIGLVAALVLLLIGFWQFMVILLFVIAGVMFGQYLDGEPKVLNAIKEWIATIRKD